MAEFAHVLKMAEDGYHDRNDYPPFALTSWEDRQRWTAYLKRLAAELDDAAQALVLEAKGKP